MPRRPEPGGGRQHFGTGTLAGIQQAHRLEPLARFGIAGKPVRLEHHRPVPFQPEPFKIGEHFGHQIHPAASPVDILDPQQELPAARPRQIVRDNRRIGVAQMQLAVGAGGKTCPDCHAMLVLWIAGHGKA
jgi:hypothetical protein